MPATEGVRRVPCYLWRYAQDQTFLAGAATQPKRFLEELALDASIDIHLVEARAKTLASYEEKSQRKQDDGSFKYTDPAAQIHDCVANRYFIDAGGMRHHAESRMRQLISRVPAQACGLCAQATPTSGSAASVLCGGFRLSRADSG